MGVGDDEVPSEVSAKILSVKDFKGRGPGQTAFRVGPSLQQHPSLRVAGVG